MADSAEGTSAVSRAAKDALRAQIEFFESFPLIKSLLTIVPDLLLVINQRREIVFSNKELPGPTASTGLAFASGIRPGGAFDCVHAAEDGLCGTTQFCRTCGANEALSASMRGVEAREECRITRTDGSSMVFRVWSKPLEIENEQYSVFVAQDISHEKRRRALERIFFHDVLNTAGTVYGFADLLQTASEEELALVKSQLVELTGRLIDEIQAQRELAEAENREIQPQPELIDTLELLRDIGEMYARHQVGESRVIRIDPESQPIIFESDINLVRRVMGNMVKNALEAIAPGETVTLYCGPCEDGVELAAHNPSVMPGDTRLQVFQRAFSTKGAGRGLGTYSMKLLTERYLGGRIAFSSSEDRGTRFAVFYPIKFTDGSPESRVPLERE